MHINSLIDDIRPHIPFHSEVDAQSFLNNYRPQDRMALVTAMYIGRSHIHDDKLNDDYAKIEFDRFYYADTVPDNEIARILYQKNSNLITYYDAFIRCISNSEYNLDKF